MKTQDRPLRKFSLQGRELHQTDAAFADDMVFSPLKRSSHSPAGKRVQHILTTLKRAVQKHRVWRDFIGQEGVEIVYLPKSKKDPEEKRDPDFEIAKQAYREFRECVDEVNRVVKRYRWQSDLIGDDDGIAEYLVPARKEDEWETEAVRWIIDAATNTRGDISRYRICSECRKWFYAITEHQKFCQDACRKRYASKNPGFKRKRLIYMRKYRRDEKEREGRSLANASKSVQRRSKD